MTLKQRNLNCIGKMNKYSDYIFLSASHVIKMTNECPVVTVPRKGIAHRVKVTKITKQYIPMITTTTTTTTAATTTSTIPTTTTTTVSTDTTTAAFKNSSFSPIYT